MVNSILSSCDNSTYVSDGLYELIDYELIDNSPSHRCPKSTSYMAQERYAAPLRNDKINKPYSKSIYCIIKNKIISLIPRTMNKYSKPKLNYNINSNFY
jgi:hypothetical protein